MFNLPSKKLSSTQTSPSTSEDTEKYQALYESSKDAIMTLSPPDWKFTAGNPRKNSSNQCLN